MSYFIMKQSKSGQNNRYCIDSSKVNLEAVMQLDNTKTVKSKVNIFFIRVLIKLLVLISFM